MAYTNSSLKWTCQKCGTVNDPDGSFCRSCGAARPGSDVMRGASDSVPAFCPCCGEALYENAQFCMYCGAQISDYIVDNIDISDIQSADEIENEVETDAGEVFDEAPADEETIEEGFDDKTEIMDDDEKTEILSDDEEDSSIKRLHWNDNNGNEDIIVITASPFVVGRSGKDVDHVIKARGISRRHFFIDRTGADYYITDINSTNGVKVNGEKIEPMARVHIEDGDVIGVGEREYTFEEIR